MAEHPSEGALERLVQLVGDYERGRIGAEALRDAIAAQVELQELVRREAGGAVERGGRVIAFGADSQLGDVHIRDAAGRDIINLTINLQAQPRGAAPAQSDPAERAHRLALIAEHRKVLHALELQAARLGLYAPPHITIEIQELKGKLAELQREVSD